ncbi:heterokaryon incompatibility protein-domain-containing protein [Rhypophila decipiens]|uniref:Heterokaryon incompatibility protein-domain-containing protein n=1 Tax=Rhypophila decipiens TaxID=261697 RepID=A0AAN6YEV1_9PEZI|nr:heterokaryon incompatibility protein-domain-containing protein [Rhypophila decipiens]
MMNSTYVYRSLPNHNTIRILHLMPGQFDEVICCTLHVYSLDQAPAYEALSYVWGNIENRKRVVVGGSNFEVTANLDTALRHLRMVKEPRIMWVDALCINQADKAEVSQQVGIMGNVFKSCERVLVWLGTPVPRRSSTRAEISRRIMGAFRINALTRKERPSTIEVEDADNPFTLTRHFANDGHIFDIPGFRRTEYDNNTDEGHGLKARFSETESFLRLWHGFCGGLQSAWWTRIWVVQEVLLPRCATVHFGSWAVEWVELKAAAENHRRHLYTCCGGAAKLIPQKYSFTVDTLLLPEVRGPGSLNSLTGPLDTVLRRYRHKNALDPRDKVYGLLGLTQQYGVSDIHPDYFQDTATVFTAAMTAIVQESPDDLCYLASEGYRKSSSTRDNLPSWVRDFNELPMVEDISVEEDMLQIYFLYTASAGLVTPAGGACYKLEPEPPSIPGRLGVFGIRIGELATLGEVMAKSDDWRAVGKVLEAWHRVAGIRLSLQTKGTWQYALRSRFWRTLIGDAVFEASDTTTAPAGPPPRSFRRFNQDTDTTALDSWISQILKVWKFRLLALVGGIKMPMDDRFVEPLLSNTSRRRFALVDPRQRDDVALVSGGAGGKKMTIGGHVLERMSCGLAPADALVGDQIWLLAGGRKPFVLRPISVTTCAGSELKYSFVGACYLEGAMDGKATGVHSEAAPCRIWLA